MKTHFLRKNHHVFLVLLAFCVLLVFLFGSGISSYFNVRWSTIELLKSSESSYHGLTKTTVVTAWFAVPGKFSRKQYHAWIGNFLANICCNVIIYTTKDQELLLRSIIAENSRCPRQGNFVLVNGSIWDMFPYFSRQYRAAYETQVAKRDQQFYLHKSVELYAIWNNKVNMLAHGARWNPFWSKYFLWVDISSFRSDSHMIRDHFPDNRQMERLLESFSGEERVVVSAWGTAKQQLTHLDSKHQVDYLIQGGFFGGTQQAVEWLRHTYMLAHDLLIARDKFAGVDQDVLSLLVRVYPTHFVLFKSYHFDFSCGGQFFVMQQFLARAEQRLLTCKLDDNEWALEYGPLISSSSSLNLTALVDVYRLPSVEMAKVKKQQLDHHDSARLI